MFVFTLIYGLHYGPAGVTIAEDADDHLIKLLDPLHGYTIACTCTVVVSGKVIYKSKKHST